MELYPHTGIPRTSFNVIQLRRKMGELKIGCELVRCLPGEKIYCIAICSVFKVRKDDNLMCKLIDF
jgi:hypothetical protein